MSGIDCQLTVRIYSSIIKNIIYNYIVRYMWTLVNPAASLSAAI